MALTVTKTGDWQTNMGNRRVSFVTIAFDNSYATGGESLTAADMGLRVVDFISFQPQIGFVFEYDYTNSKVKVYTQGAAHAAAGAATLDDYAVTAGPGVSSGISIAREASAGAVTSRWGPLKEIANTDDLSTITSVRVVAFGV